MKNKFWLTLTGATISLACIAYVSFPTEEKGIRYMPPIEAKTVALGSLYGFPLDSFEVSRGEVQQSQSLSDILKGFNISRQKLHKLARVAEEVHSVRKLRAGLAYAIIYEEDSFKTAQQFIFETSPAEYVVYNFADSIYAQIHQRPVEIRERALVVEIRSSMYEAIVHHSTSPALVGRLVDIFAWQIDFFRIAKGDKLKLIFEEKLVDGEVIGIGDIKAVCFDHRKKKYYAIFYESETEVAYFDEEGNSLRKAFLRAPLTYSRISSRFSLRRFHPVQKRYKPHLGTDYAAPHGTPIHTVGNGVVLEARYSRGNGNYVKIRHNSTYTTQYLHMSKIAKNIKLGVKVKQGKVIGYVGSTGLATGPHLCFRFWKNGRQVDALKVDLSSSKGIASESLEAFKVVADSLKAQLDAMIFHESEPAYAGMSYSFY